LKELSGRRVDDVEARMGVNLEFLLDEAEEALTPIRKVAENLGVPYITVQSWRKKRNYPRRKHFNEKG